MIVGLGLDVAELDRIAAIWERHGRRFAARILTAAELACLPRRPVPFLAARFAVKEAGAKALGTGFAEGVTYASLETVSLPTGQPVLRLRGVALARAVQLGVTDAHVSLTHGRDVAAAVVVLERVPGRPVLAAASPDAVIPEVP